MLFILLAASAATENTEKQNMIYERLIANMAKGDTEALELLFKQTKSVVYGFALSIVKHHENAEDVLQDTYVKLFQGAKTYNPQGKPMAWIMTITKNTALMKLRRQNEVAFPENVEISSDENFSENSIDRIILKMALSYLSLEEREIVVLHAISGLKHRELSEVLGLPLPTVLSKYRRALAKLRKRLEAEHNEIVKS